MLHRLLILLVFLAEAACAAAADWVRAGLNTNQTVWGIRNGLLWAVAPAGFRPGEPRGLIRLGYPVLSEGGYDLINFIAVEPIVRDRRGFSELERSQLDGVSGKRIWAEDAGGAATTKLVPGRLTKGPGEREELEVPLRVEKFENGAHVRLVVRQRSERPDEIELSVFQEPDSAPLDYCILTATMGNMARTRLLWLKDEVVSSLALYPGYKESGFAAHREYSLSQLYRADDGQVLVAVSNDEENPATVYPVPNSEFWHYAGRKVTQYWAKAPGAFREDLRVAVNARYTYWQSARPIPGGVAFENFELRERFYDGQKFIFGITRRTPEELGFKKLKTAEDLRLVPFPKSVAMEAGCFSFGKALSFEVSDGEGELLAQLTNAELQRAGLPAARVKRLKSTVPSFRLAAKDRALVLPALPQQASSESYALDVRAEEIVCAARDPAGLFYGVQTLCQLIRANRQGETLPCLKISDWPSLRWRCFQDDLTRGPSSTLDTLKFEASLGSYLKLNLMTYYMEYQFAFKKHPEIGPPNGSLTPEDLSALVAYAKPLHLDVLGNQQSFGHFGQILKHPEYAPMRETPDLVTPVREETYQLLDDLYSEVCPLVPFPWFNVCCDETDGLGTGPSRELASSIGVGGVYVRHIRRIHDLLRDKHNKRMMMWGDIILQHPGNLGDVPKDTIMLIWGYDARASFEAQILPFSKSGYEFFVCPGVSDWNRILPDFGVALTNIKNFVRDGVKQGAIGMLNTDWEDDAEALKAVKWHPDAWAAECAWNASSNPSAAFNRRVGAVLFGEQGDEFGQAVELLSQTHRLPGMKDMFNARFWEKDFMPNAAPAAIQATASNLLAIVQPALQHLETCRRHATCNQHVLEVFLFGARRMELIGQRMLDGLEAAQVYEQIRQGQADASKLAQVEQLIRKNRDAHQTIGRQFAALWLSESKPYALDWNLGRYTNVVNEYEGLLRKLETADSAAANGQPLPTADELGLAAAKPLFRPIRPAEISPEPMAADSPWADPSATRRLGLLVRAGAIDRFDLPIEVEVAVPADLAAKPVRAFLIATNEPREILAQLDALDSTGKSRLILMLPGTLPHGTEAPVHIYLGLAQASAPLATAVTTTDGTNGMRWIENDQVRLLLGPEGAHVYRWEVKAAGARDLTMPGESGWAGFSDQQPHRGSTYQLSCKVRGPAMVEYECNDPWGHTKTLRLYGGTSWIEVLLNEPTTVYWDFDNPKNFAADGPTPGQWLFSDGRSGAVGREAEGVPAQVKASNTYWVIKHNADRLALGLVTPETATLHVVAPGAGAGGVGIEGSPAASHFVTFAGLLTAPPTESMNHLQTTLDLLHSVEVRLHKIQAR